MDWLVEPPTERAKRFLAAFDTVEDAVYMGGLSNVPEIEIYEAKYYYDTTTLPAVMKMPWRDMICARINERLSWLEAELVRRNAQYLTIQPFRARKVWYQRHIPPLEALILLDKQRLTIEPSIEWNIAEVASLKRLGPIKYLRLFVDRFYPV